MVATLVGHGLFLAEPRSHATCHLTGRVNDPIMISLTIATSSPVDGGNFITAAWIVLVPSRVSGRSSPSGETSVPMAAAAQAPAKTTADMGGYKATFTIPGYISAQIWIGCGESNTSIRVP